MSRVHIIEGGEYECTHYSVHTENDCDPRYHPPYVEAEMRDGIISTMQAVEQAYAETQVALQELFIAGEYKPGM